MAVVAEMYSNHPIAKSLKDELIKKDKSVLTAFRQDRKTLRLKKFMVEELRQN